MFTEILWNNLALKVQGRFVKIVQHLSDYPVE